MAVCVKGMLAVSGGFLIHLTLGTLYSFGNLTPYIVSYVRQRSVPTSLTYQDGAWVSALTVAGQGASMFAGGLIEQKVGVRWASLLGGWLTSAGFALGYVTLGQSFYLWLLTCGVMFGVGVGWAYTPTLHCAMQWFPDSKGLAGGVVVAGFGGGAFVFNQLHTAYINPWNFSPDKDVNGVMYFSQKQLLDRVPSFFLVFGGIYAVIQLIGCCLLFSAPPTVALNEEKEDEEKKPLVENGEQKKPLVAEASSVGIDVPPLAVLRTRSFWTLWIIIATVGQGIFFVANLYKVYGQTFIYDDKFLALVGSLASIGNSLGRIMWGIVIDKSTFKTCMLCLNAGLFALFMTLIATPHGGATMYAVWISAIYLLSSGLFILIPTAVSRCFGQKYFAITFGLVCSANAITTPIGALLASLLLDPLGWFGMFSLVSACVLAAIAFTFTFNGKRADGRPV